MKGIMARLQAIEEKVDRLLCILDGVEIDEAAASEPKPGNRCYHWQPADDKVLKRMFKEGATDAEIAASLHRTPNGIMNRRNKLGMRRRGKKA